MKAHDPEAEGRRTQRLEALANMSGGLAHQFNELLTTIIGYAEIACEEANGNPTLRDALEHIQAAAQRATSLTQQLLAFGRRRERKPETVDLNQSIRTIQSVLQHVLGPNIRLVSILDPHVGTVEVDREQLEEAITHLLVHGRESMPNGGTLCIETRNVELNRTAAPVALAGDCVMIAVSNTGQGMDEETRSRIFEPFFSTSAQETEIGLGLAAVHGIVEQNGGAIMVEAEAQHGTTFRIYLPRANQLATVPTSVPPPPRHSGPILLVDDDPSVRRLAGEILRRHEHRVFEACDGQSAIALMKGQNLKIDLLITDLKMPGMNGYDLAKRIQQLSPATRVLFVSGFPENDDDFHSVSPTHLLLKPFTVGDFLAKVDEVMHEPALLEARSA